MASTFVSNYVHIVFSTKERMPFIKDQQKMWRYLAGIAQNIGCLPMAIGGMPDHVHVLIGIPPDASIAKTVNALKANSSRWMNMHSKGFAWQRGYAAFSVSASNLRAVTEYVENQAKHHKQRDFQQELIALLQKHNLPFDPRYVFS